VHLTIVSKWQTSQLGIQSKHDFVAGFGYLPTGHVALQVLGEAYYK